MCKTSSKLTMQREHQNQVVSSDSHINSHPGVYRADVQDGPPVS